MAPRPIEEVLIDDSLIQSGDFFGIIRLDGLDPMLAWAMGTSTGHTTVALRTPEGDLFICESTTKDSYWPVNGIQCTNYRQWLIQAQAADYNVVWSPLTDEARAQFDANAAWDFFRSVQGVDYGFYNMLFAWIDTAQDNYPCLPPDYNMCLEAPHFECLFGFIDTFAPSIADKMMNEALNHRLGTTGLDSADLGLLAFNQGINMGDLYTWVESDDWLYNTTRWGEPFLAPSMMCDTFVCRIWKAGGLFGNLTSEINCGEFTNWDAYTLTLLAIPKRPQECVVADPDNFLCQIEGKYSLSLPDFNTKSLYPHIAEHCPGYPPDYAKPPNC